MMLSSAAARTLRKLGTSSSSSSARCWASTLVVSDPVVDGGATPAETLAAVTAAAQLGQPVELLVVGDTAPTKIPAGVSKVYHVAIGDKLSETVALAIQAAVAASGDISVVMGTSSKFGSTVIPRAAALLNVSPITDILKIEDDSK
jgi:electron transfer flavoprotein alpha subunit